MADYSAGPRFLLAAPLPLLGRLSTGNLLNCVDRLPCRLPLNGLWGIICKPTHPYGAASRFNNTARYFQNAVKKSTGRHQRKTKCHRKNTD